MPEPRLSVVIPTRNRQALVHQLLDSLAQLQITAGEMEVVVVDDASQDHTPESLEKRHDPYPLKLIRNPIAGGPSAARNLGSQAARGTILGFLDSDVTVQPAWWQAASQHFARPEVAAVEGATLPPAGSTQPTPFTHFVHNQRGGSYQTCNFLVRAESFRQVGGFDERFCWRDHRGKIWHIREDTDLAFMLLARKSVIVFEPQAVAIHPLLPASRKIYLSNTYYGSREALLRRKHPQLYREKLGWLNGRAFPIFYWPVFIGGPLLVLAEVLHWPEMWLALAVGLVGLGWIGSVYAVCRKRHVILKDVMILLPQFLIIPWMRLFWVAVGEWKFRKVSP